VKEHRQFTFIKLHRSTYVDAVVVTDRVASSVCRSVCRSVTVVSPAKMAGPIGMPFGLWVRVGPRNHVLDGGPYFPIGMGNFEGEKGRAKVKYRDTPR